MSTTEPIQLVVGLGNPGKQYEQTRHNAGFWFADAVAEYYRGDFRYDSKHKADVASVEIAGQKIWLLKPLTFMNLSGQSVVSLASFYRIPPAAILVAHDELDLEAGIIRLKWSGGHGGHNGLRDISQKLGKDFWRMRIGVSHPGDRHMVTDFVLGKPSQEDRRAMEDAIDRGMKVFEDIVRGDTQRAMHSLHSK